ncbi:MAG TPA: IS1595 family transposase [Nitrospiraceae bacterium]
MAEDYPRTLVELERRFSDDAACRQYLFALRWPAGFRCPRCQRENAWPISRGLWLCTGCRTQVSVLAGTVFQDTHLPLTVWFRAMWHMTSQKNGMSALGLQRVLGLGSYKTAWLMLHKLRQAMVRPGRERLRGVVEVDETYWGATESGGATGRLIYSKELIVVAAEQDGKGIGRIRMARIPDFDRATLHGFIRSSVEPGSTIRTDGLNSYREIEGYVHNRKVQRRLQHGEHMLPRVHRAVSLLKRWMLGTHQGAVRHQHLEDYLNEFVFRFNRRKSASRGKLFYRIAQQAAQIAPTTYEKLVRPQDLVHG